MENYRKSLEKIDGLLNKLNKKELIQFGIYNVQRIINIYKYFDIKYDISLMDNTISKGNGYNRLKELLDNIKTSLYKDNTNVIIGNIERYKLLIPDPDIYDTNAICYMAELIVSSLINIMEYYINNDIKKIKYIVNACIEIINQIKGDEYYQIEENNKKINVPTEYLEPYLIKEFETEEKIIEMIKLKEDNIIKEFIENNIIIK